jgi:aspartate carbamoyltransferase catalytic subunit
VSTEEKTLELISDFADGLEAVAFKLKRDVATLAGKKESASKEETSDFSKLFWEKKTGTKGEFEQTSERANQNCVLWQQLKTKLKENKGFWQHNGFKYWNDMGQETIIDRRKA